MKGKKHSDEVQAQVMAALLAGQGVSEIAREYNLDKSVVSRIKSSSNLQQLQPKKGEEIETLLFDYLRTTLDTLKNQAEIVGEREYVSKQPAGELAVLHGVMADKAVRLLEAAERARITAPAQLNPAPE
jgi:transposase-like protein